MAFLLSNILGFLCVSACNCFSARASDPSKRITSVLPTCGPLNGATSVTIKGKGFLPTDTVRMGSLVVSSSHVVYESTEEIVVIVSGHLTATSKNYTLNVLSSDGKVKSNTRYFYLYDTPNYIQKIQPKIGWEGDTLSVQGNFLDCGVVKCRFGAVQMTVDATYVSKTEVKCKVPMFDSHGVSSTSSFKANVTHNDSIHGNVGVAPPPDPDKAKKITISSDGQHFDSIPDNIVFTYRDPVQYVVMWIWLVALLACSAFAWLTCIAVCCICGYENIKKKCCSGCCNPCNPCKRCKHRKGYTRIQV